MKYLLVFLALFAGCATMQAVPTPANILLGPNPQFETLPAFNKLKNLSADTQEYEAAKVQYLLDRMSKSPYVFLRNNLKYNGRKAAVHLKWKYYKNYKTAPSAELFISRLTTSKQSGEPYYLQIGDKAYRCSEIFRNELSLLDQALANNGMPSRKAAGIQEKDVT